MKFVITAIAVAALAGCAHVCNQEAGPERTAAVVRTNAFTSSSQDHVVLDRAPDGRYVVAWDSRRQQEGQYGVYARVVDADGHPLTAETQLNTYTTNAQMRPALAIAPDGHVWAAWQSHHQDGDGWGIIARRLEADLGSATPEIGINQTRVGHQAEPVISVTDDAVLIAWTSIDEAGNAIAMARLYTHGAEPITDELVLDASDSIRQTTLSAAAAGDAFVLAWTDVDAHDRSSIRGAIVDPDGSIATRDLVTGHTDNLEPSVAARDDGTFAVAWLASEDDGYAVHARCFDHRGVPTGPSAVISPADMDSPRNGVAIAHLLGDAWYVAFNAAGEDVLVNTADLRTGKVGVASPLLDADGTRRLDAARGTTRIVSAQTALAVGVSGDAGLGDSSGAHLVIHGVPAFTWAPETEQAVLATAVAEPHIPPTFDPNFEPPARDPGIAGDGDDFGFNAVPFTGWTPPDPEMAVGPNHIVVMTNGNISVFDKSGNIQFSDQIEGGAGFWGALGTGGFVFDPEALYDPFSNRYWAMANERTGGQSFFLFAVSASENAAGPWHKYRVNVTPIPGIGGDIDSPNFAVDEGHIYLTADFFTPSTRFLFYMVDKAPLLVGNPAPAGTSIVNVGTQSFGIPQHSDGTAPRQYVIESTEFNTNSVVRLHAINDPGGAPSLSSFTLDVPTYRYPGSPNQLGTGTTPILFEPRFWSAEYINGSLWAVHHIRNVGQSNTIVRWYEIDMNGWPTSGLDPDLAQWGEIDAGGNTHTYFPSISANEDGDAAITFSRSSTSEYISMWRAVRQAGDPEGTFQEMQLVKSSTSPQTSGRWGDYSQTRFDPAQPCAFWGHNEWTNNASSWGTWVAQYLNLHPADINEDCELSILDFVAFQNLFQAGDPKADFNGDGNLDILDFVAYQAAFLS